ncbi:hypothetical protein CAI21_05600 [Alkalilimnicola ehrlichii]|uniref:HTH tetR-type domain-containing protein n=1 Tax=Alkalilimnicola ehrlichii TaxID=351052 RepID=A0A3E0WYJ5_9GAMM|nr:TetR/AcrR family transcriptional regulator [Alkalilimnicola ehrlichii]RFA30522.1 hypothetical protein CAI21_05600 [Alkalilimnicola ehrlichii]RFA38070.1 hypothetical protein CAL65_06970 [Alkalilimnicola ehrlichii]
MGRKLEFDPDEKLKAAMRLFWAKGYAGTSLQDLVEQLEINRFSLYNTFGDKRQLFVTALERYSDQIIGRLIEPLLEPNAGLDALDRYLEQLQRGLNSSAGDFGCLVQTIGLEAANGHAELKELAVQRLQQLGELLRQTLLRAREQGLLAEHIDPTAAADMLLAQVQGAIFLRRATGNSDQSDRSLGMLRQQLRTWRTDIDQV